MMGEKGLHAIIEKLSLSVVDKSTCSTNDGG